ncbi:unnamed protein product [Arctogadus glacialis]
MVQLLLYDDTILRSQTVSASSTASFDSLHTLVNAPSKSSIRSFSDQPCHENLLPTVQVENSSLTIIIEEGSSVPSAPVNRTSLGLVKLSSSGQLY